MTDKKKQIEEMAEFIHVDSSFLGYEEDARQLAEELYKGDTASGQSARMCQGFAACLNVRRVIGRMRTLGQPTRFGSARDAVRR